MSVKTKKIIVVSFIVAAVSISAIISYRIILAITYFYTPNPSIQMVHNLDSQQERRIAEIAGIDAEYKILYVEKWKAREPVLLIWIAGEDNTEKSSLNVDGFNKKEKVRKYDPLSRTFVTGNYYENNSFVTIYAYKSYSGNFIKYQIGFISPGALNSIYDIFSGIKEYKAGPLEEYDSWRLQLDEQYKDEL
jgi:hypothetical protein